MDKFYDELMTVVTKARQHGYAVVVWTPEETEGMAVDCEALEDIVTERGNEFIETMGGNDR